MASLKEQATGFLQFIEAQINALDAKKESVWISLDEAAAAAKCDRDGLRGLLRRPRVKTLLKELGVGCSFRSAHVFAYKLPNYGTSKFGSMDVGDVDGDDTSNVVAKAPAAPAAPAMVFDPDYFYMPEPVTADINLAIDAGQNVFIVGPAGSGKTSLLERICIKRGTKPIVISLHGEVSVDDFVGAKDLVGGQTVFTEGVLPTAMRRGVPLIIDEADATPPDVQFVLHPVLMGQPLCLTRKGAEFVTPEPGFCILATGNTVGRGDDSGLYVGTNTLNEAYLDRYGMVVEHWYLPANEEVTVLVKRTGIHKVIAENMVKVAGLAREAMLSDALSSTFSTRKLLDWCKFVTRGMNLTRAFIYSCINKVGREDRRTIAEFGQRIFAKQLEIDPSKYV